VPAVLSAFDPPYENTSLVEDKIIFLALGTPPRLFDANQFRKSLQLNGLPRRNTWDGFNSVGNHASTVAVPRSSYAKFPCKGKQYPLG
jgi:hypothetical protein